MSRNFNYPDLFERAIQHFGPPPQPIPPPDAGGYWPPSEMQGVIDDVFPLPALDALPFPQDEGDELSDLWQDEAPAGGMRLAERDVKDILGDHGAEALAWYVPYALSPNQWGVYFNGHYFPEYLTALANELRPSARVLWPVAFHQILVHELTHFHFECVGTQLDIAMRHRKYPSYVLQRYTCQTLYGPGPLEEALATSREMAFARGVRSVALPGDTGFRPGGYAGLLETVPYGPGYAEWNAVSAPADRPRVRDLIRDHHGHEPRPAFTRPGLGLAYPCGTGACLVVGTAGDAAAGTAQVLDLAVHCTIRELVDEEHDVHAADARHASQAVRLPGRQDPALQGWWPLAAARGEANGAHIRVPQPSGLLHGRGIDATTSQVRKVPATGGCLAPMRTRARCSYPACTEKGVSNVRRISTEQGAGVGPNSAAKSSERAETDDGR